MTKLTDSQLILLSRAAQSEDGYLQDAGSMNAGAAFKVAGALMRKKLLREVRTRSGLPIWRQDEDGRNWSLAITKAGRKAIHVDEGCEEEATSDKGYGKATDRAEHDGNARPDIGADRIAKAANPEPKRSYEPNTDANIVATVDRQLRQGTKLAKVVAMLRMSDGATIASMMDATGWLPHTTRAALTGLRHRGFVIEKMQIKGEPTLYHIPSDRLGGEAVTSTSDQAIAA